MAPLERSSSASFQRRMACELRSSTPFVVANVKVTSARAISGPTRSVAMASADAVVGPSRIMMTAS
jgi:hypothetical protein